MSSSEFTSLKEKIISLSNEVHRTNEALNSLGLVKMIAFQSSVNDLGVQLEKVRTFNEYAHYLQSDIKNLNKLLEPINALASEKIKNEQVIAKTMEQEFKLKLAQVKANEPMAYKHYESLQEDWSAVPYLVGGFMAGIFIGLGINPKARL